METAIQNNQTLLTFHTNDLKIAKQENRSEEIIKNIRSSISKLILQNMLLNFGFSKEEIEEAEEEHYLVAQYPDECQCELDECECEFESHCITTLRGDLQECPICYETKFLRITNCKHQICLKCLKNSIQIFEDTRNQNLLCCPLCRNNLTS